MANAKNSKKKSKKPAATRNAARNTAPQPRIVLFGVPEDSERGALVRETIAALSVPTRTVQPEELATPVGAFAGMKGFHASKAPFEGDVPAVEFMLICNFANTQLDELLAAMRAANCSIGCKAQVTQYNRFWPLVKLIEEVSAEHALMSE